MIAMTRNDSLFQNRNQPWTNGKKEYKIGCYVVHSYTNANSQRIIEHSLDQSCQSYLELIDRIEAEIIKKMECFHANLEELIPFDQLAQQIRVYFQRNLQTLNVNDEVKDAIENLYYYLFFKMFGLKTLGPYLIDNFVHEIYVEKNGKLNYLDHELWGRCLLGNSISLDEINRIVSLVLLENNAFLSRVNPSFKGDLVSRDFHLRVSIDAPPLSIDGLQLDIRKIYPYYIHLFRLLDSNSLNLSIISTLLVVMRLGTSITIIGPPNTGKTTIQNNLLQYLPPQWRIISIEDAIESPPYLFSPHLRLKISERDEQLGIGGKSLESLKLLRRSPDYVNLGEISNKLHARAWFQTLASGIPSIQTIHGRDWSQLLVRVKEIFGIPPTLISTSFPHFFVEMNSFWIQGRKVRKIINVGELRIFREKSTSEQNESSLDDQNPTNFQDFIQISPLYQWNPSEQNWTQIKSLMDSDTGHYILKTRGIPKARLERMVKCVSDIISSYHDRWKKRRMDHDKLGNKKNYHPSLQFRPDATQFLSKSELLIIEECYHQINDFFRSVELT